MAYALRTPTSTRLKSFYVMRMPDDERGIEKLIATRLAALGFKSTSGDAQTPPAPVDGIVTYQDRWMWDITMYMIRLDIQVRDGSSGAILANGQVMRPYYNVSRPKAWSKKHWESFSNEDPSG